MRFNVIERVYYYVVKYYFFLKKKCAIVYDAGAPNGGFRLNALKTLFRQSATVLDL